MLRSDGKRSDGLTQISWQSGKCMSWDVKVTDTLADRNLSTTPVIAGAAAEGTVSRKEAKYQALATTHSFISLAFETLGPINAKGLSFFNELGRRLSARSGEPRENFYFSSALTAFASMAVF